MEVRLCYPIAKETYMFTGNENIGSLAEVGRLTVHQLRGVNFSENESPSIGVLIDHTLQKYDGCIGLMQNNESDIMTSAGLLNIPVMGPNLTHTVVDGFDRMGIISAYNRVNMSDVTPTHVLDMVLAFSPDLWILICFAYVILLILLTAAMKTHVRKERESDEAVFASREAWVSHQRSYTQRHKSCASKSSLNVTACILNQHSSCEACLVDFAPISLLYTMTTLLSYFGAYFLTSMIKTDMVVVKAPITVTTYDELLNSNRRALWIGALTDRAEFENAAKGSKEDQIWQRAVAMGINESIGGTTFVDFVDHGTKIALQEKVVLYGGNIFMPFLSRTACTFGRTKHIHDHVNSLYRHDPSAKGFLRGNVQNHLLSGRTSARINKRIQWSFEGSLLEVTLARFTDVSSHMNVNDADQYFRAIDECASNVIEIPHPEATAVGLFHYVSLFGLCSLLFFVSSIVLGIESTLLSRKKRPKPHTRAEPLLSRKRRRVQPAPVVSLLS